MTATSQFTGRKRRLKTPLSVRWADRTARLLIVVGGIGTIAVVSTVFLFLVWVVAPLFLSATTQLVAHYESRRAAAPLIEGMTENGELGWSVDREGALTVFALHDGQLVEKRQPFGDIRPTAASLTLSQAGAVFGFDDGTIRRAEIELAKSDLTSEEISTAARQLEPGQSIVDESALLTRMDADTWQRRQLVFALDEEPVELAPGARIEQVDLVVQNSGPVVAAITADNRLMLRVGRSQTNLLTGEETVEFSGSETVLPDAGDARPSHLRVSGLADSVYVAWDDGRLLRFDVAGQSLSVVEELDVVDAPGGRLVALKYLPGRATLVAADSAGSVTAWFRIRPAQARTSDGWTLVKAHTMGRPGAEVASVAVSERDRLVAIGYRDGQIEVYYPTTENRIAELSLEGGRSVDSLLLGSKGNRLLAASGNQAALWNLDARHPDASFRGLLRPVWYEGYSEPAHVWQSTGGTDDPEPKFGLVPLIFGTLKATAYSLLFGVPVALLAAIYTSEYLHPRMRARVKPTVELMASLPSVVLGFIAALVLAPFVEHVLPAVLAGGIVIPAVFLLGGYLWQLLPGSQGAFLAAQRFWVVLVVLPVGLAISAFAGPWLEELLFAGNVKAWLDGRRGAAMGGWVYLLLPLGAVAAAFIMGRWINPWLRNRSGGWTRRRAAWFELLKFGSAGLIAIGLTVLASWILQSLHFDPRGSIIGTYDQRNALVVGFVMGFAIIPIIYTIADDALSTVPNYLRSASLGAGATPWQTAVRVVVPTAMSGLFSAVMVGLGRAVGETMIVLMAAGNTPIMDWSIFNGFRTLSANIAVEMPEAVQNSTHYRILFLAALTLFGITFLLNSVAELIRQRFRRRAYQL